MTRQTKKAVAAIDAATLLGEVALVRSSIWMNGRRKVAAIVTDATTDAVLLPEGAVALVSLTAFPPGAPSRMMVDVPLYPKDLDDSTLPLAWIKSAE
jgi:hypothetical protein